MMKKCKINYRIKLALLKIDSRLPLEFIRKAMSNTKHSSRTEGVYLRQY